MTLTIASSRCYRYRPGDFSAPHYDRSFTEHAPADTETGGRAGRLVSLSAFSLLLYLSDGYVGGETTFFEAEEGVGRSRRKLTPAVGARLVPSARVRGGPGDALLFPHGLHAGCHPDPLHEGSVVTDGEKVIIRTDIVFKPQPKPGGSQPRRPRRAPAGDRCVGGSEADLATKGPAKSRRHPSDSGVLVAEELVKGALLQLCPEYAGLAKGSVTRQTDPKAAELCCTAAAKVYWAAKRRAARPPTVDTDTAAPTATAVGTDLETLPAAAEASPGAVNPADTVELTSDFGVRRVFDRRSLAQRVVEALAGPAVATELAFVGVAPGPAGTVLLTTRSRAAARAADGLAPCSRCGRFVSVSTQGVEWHMKNVHGTTVHAQAYEAAEAAQRALIAYGADRHPLQPAAAPSNLAPDLLGVMTPPPPTHLTQPSRGRLNRSDMARAQASPAAAARLVQEGKVRSLGPGLEACRSGNIEALQRLVERDGWDPATARDRHGSGALVWAAGGGHLACCQYLVTRCGVPATEAQQGRRGYDGRSALHWAARNGHLEVVTWLVEGCGCPADHPSADGTTPFCLAVWQGHLDVCRFLVTAKADPHASNSYGCNAALWAAQGPATSVDTFAYLVSLGVDLERINDNGQGCLHKAAQRRNGAVCRWLLEVAEIRSPHHFEPNASERSVPSTLARYAGDDRLAEMLLEWENKRRRDPERAGQS